MNQRTTGGYSTPLKAMFEMQRSAMKTGQRMIGRSRAFQRSATDAMLTGFRAQELSQRQAVELSRIGAQNYLTAVKMAMPGGERDIEEAQQGVDAQFDELKAVHGDAFDTLEANITEYEEAADEFLETLQEQTESAVDSQRRAEVETLRTADEVGRAVEQTASETAGATARAAEEVTEETAEATERATQSTLDAAEDVAETAAETTEEVTETAAEATEDAAEATAETTEDVTETAAETVEETAEATEDATDTSAETTDDVAEESDRATLDQRIHGIGDAHAESLRDADIESLEDLARAEADDVAESADVSAERAQEWIDRAGATHAQDVDLVDGIGDAHAESLHEAGIETVADLAAADADDVAAAAHVSENRAQEWIDDAQSRQEEGIEIVDGIGESRAESLREAGIETLADLAASDADRVADAADVSEEQADEWIDAAQA